MSAQYLNHFDNIIHTITKHNRMVILCINEIFVVAMEQNMFCLYCNMGYGGSAVERPSSVIVGFNPTSSHTKS